MVNPAIQIIAPDDEGMIALLDESNSLIEEGNNLEAELLQGEEGDASWFQKFTGKLKTELDNCSDIVKEKIIDMKVRMSSKMESELEAKDAQQHSSSSTERLGARGQSPWAPRSRTLRPLRRCLKIRTATRTRSTSELTSSLVSQEESRSWQPIMALPWSFSKSSSTS